MKGIPAGAYGEFLRGMGFVTQNGQADCLSIQNFQYVNISGK